MTERESATAIAALPTTDPFFELDRWFDDFAWPFGHRWAIARTEPTGPRAPRVDLSDLGASFKIVAEIPGIPKENLDVRVRGSLVEIRGEGATQTEKSKGALLHQERRYEGFFRAVELPEPVVADRTTAKVENGVLEVELPKANPTPSPDGLKIPVA